WSSRASAVDAVKVREADGIGFVLTGTEVVAIDLDHCRDPASSEVDPWALSLIERAGSCTEITVSGTGLRVIGKGAGKETHTNYKVEGRVGAKIEVYRRTVRYITVSGVEIGHCASLSNIDALIDDLIAQYGEKHADAGGRGNLWFGKR